MADVNDFIYFVNERYNIYINKEIKKLNFPYTNDLILQQYHFCNISRKLDKTTIYLYELFKDKENKIELLFNIIIHRLFSKKQTSENLKYISLEDFNDIDFLLQLYDIFGYQKLLYTSSFSRNTSIFSLVKYIDNLFYDIEDLYNKINKSDKLENIFEYLKNINGINNFLAFEILNDLMNFEFIDINKIKDYEVFIKFNNDSKKAMNLLKLKPTLKNIIYLKEVLKLINYKFTIYDIEHALCEFYRYSLLKNNTNSKSYPIKKREIGGILIKNEYKRSK